MYRANILRVVKRYNSRDTVPKNRLLRQNKPNETKKKDDGVKTSASEAIKLLRALQKSQNEPITKSLVEQQTEKEKTAESDLDEAYLKFKENFIKNGVPDLGLFDPKKVQELRENSVYLGAESAAYSQKIYRAFQNECYDDGYNEAHRRWLNDSYVRLPTTNEEGARHQDLNSHWSKHVFLDDYVNLFPPGQIRVFMEAAACGLSQNPFLTVPEKQEHMEWFRQYFLNIEEDLINNEIIEPGALPDHPILTPGDDGMWPSEREIRKKYSEMNPFEKDWYAEQFGPMSHRIKKRRAKLEQLEEMDMAIEHELQEE